MNALTKVYEGIAPNVYTSAGVCELSLMEGEESVVLDANSFIWRKALWDTGATQSCISDRLAENLSLEIVGFVEINSAVGTHSVPAFRANLALPNIFVFHDTELLQFTYTEDDCDLIIGMGIMTQGDLSLTNQFGRTVFSFRIPSSHTLDFEAQHSAG
jgi:hypothetical protein